MQAEWLQGVLEALPQGICAVDVDGTILFTNAAHDRLFGRPRGWFDGRPVRDSVADAEVRGHLMAAVRQAVREGTAPPTQVLPMGHADGRRLRVKMEWSSHFDETGRCRGLTCTVTDMTDRRRAEATLAAAQRMAKVGHWHLEPRSGRLVWSPEVSRVFGLPLDHTSGERNSLMAGIHPQDREAKQRALAGVLSAGGQYRMTYRLAAASGGARLVEERAEALRDDSGAIVLVRAVVQDVTLLHQAVQEARDMAARLDQALRLGQMGTWDWDRSSGTIWWSEEARRLLGVSDEAPVDAAAFLELIHAEDRAGVEAWLSGLSPEDGPQTYEFRLCRPDGAARMFHAEVDCLRSDDGRCILRGVHRDVTEARQREGVLREAVEEAHEAMKEGAHLLAVVAGDIRETLRGIADGAAVLADGRPRESDRVGARAASIEAAARSLLALVDGLQDLGLASSMGAEQEGRDGRTAVTLTAGLRQVLTVQGGGAGPLGGLIPPAPSGIWS